MVADGVIEEAEDSAWCSPIVPVKKPDGSVRVCIVTPMVKHYMPILNELLDRAGNCSVLTTLDLTAGFHQVLMEESSKGLTTFGSPWGRLRFWRMPFGLKNAPAIFQRMVDGVLAKVQECCGCYIDDDWCIQIVGMSI